MINVAFCDGRGQGSGGAGGAHGVGHGGGERAGGSGRVRAVAETLPGAECASAGKGHQF